MTEQRSYQDLVADAKKKIPEISPTDAAAKAKNGNAVIVDVREKDEFDEAPIPDAVHMSRGTIELDIKGKFPGLNNDNHLSLRWRRPFRARGEKFAKDGVDRHGATPNHASPQLERLCELLNEIRTQSIGKS